MAGPVRLERDGAVARITLDRPEQGNAVDMALAEGFSAAAIACAEDAGVRCVLLTGAGRQFCVGGDITAFAAAGEGAGQFLRELAGTLHRGVAALAGMAKPVVVAVNGPAAGAGLSLAIAGDIVLAAESASFSAAYGSVGLTPDGGMSWLLPRLVGMRRAQEIIVASRRIDAAEAAAIGLVTRTVANDALAGEAAAAATRLAAGPTAAIGGARALLAAAATNTFERHLALEVDRIAAAGDTAECREGVAAFIERRRPDFAKDMTA